MPPPLSTLFACRLAVRQASRLSSPPCAFIYKPPLSSGERHTLTPPSPFQGEGFPATPLPPRERSAARPGLPRRRLGEPGEGASSPFTGEVGPQGRVRVLRPLPLIRPLVTHHSPLTTLHYALPTNHSPLLLTPPIRSSTVSPWRESDGETRAKLPSDAGDFCKTECLVRSSGLAQSISDCYTDRHAQKGAWQQKTRPTLNRQHLA